MFKKIDQIWIDVKTILIKMDAYFSSKDINSVDLMRKTLGSINIADLKPEPEKLQDRKEFTERIEVSYADLLKVLDCMINAQVDNMAHTDPRTVMTGFGHGTLNGIELVREKLQGYHLEVIERRKPPVVPSIAPGINSVGDSPFPLDTPSPNEQRS